MYSAFSRSIFGKVQQKTSYLSANFINDYDFFELDLQCYM